MVLQVSSIGDNQQVPGISAETYIPDQLIAGNLKLVTASVTVTGGADLKRGTLMGRVTASGSYVMSASAAADGSQVPVGVLADVALCATNAADQICGIYQMGEFNANAMTFGAGWTAATAAAAIGTAPIYLKNIGVLDLTFVDPT